MLLLGPCCSGPLVDFSLVVRQWLPLLMSNVVASRQQRYFHRYPISEFSDCMPVMLRAWVEVWRMTIRSRSWDVYCFAVSGMRVRTRHARLRAIVGVDIYLLCLPLLIVCWPCPYCCSVWHLIKVRLSQHSTTCDELVLSSKSEKRVNCLVTRTRNRRNNTDWWLITSYL